MLQEGYYLLYGPPGDDGQFQVSTIGDLDDSHVAGTAGGADARAHAAADEGANRRRQVFTGDRRDERRNRGPEVARP